MRQRNTAANRIAVLLHKCCTTLAVLLHGLCSTTAYATQHCCKGRAVKLQKPCSKRAEAKQKNRQGKVPQPWSNRSRPDKAGKPRMTEKKAGVCPLANVRASEVFVCHFYSPGTSVPSQSHPTAGIHTCFMGTLPRPRAAPIGQKENKPK